MSRNDTANSEAYFQQTCELAQQNGVTIYTIALNLSASDGAKLANCVGINGQFYPANSADALTNAFEDIARRLGTNRLTG